MADITIDTIGKVLMIYGYAMAGGLGLSLGVIGACRMLKWTPINVIVQVIDQRPIE